MAAAKKQPAAHPLGKPSSTSQSSRKTKSSWRKNISLPPSIDTPPSTAPPAPHTLTNAQLFTEDRSADRTSANAILGVGLHRKKKGSGGLKSLEVLKNRSDVPAVPGRARTSGISKATKNQLRRIAQRPVLGGQEDGGAAGVKEAVKEAEFDMWDQQQQQGGEKGEEEWIEDPRRVQAKAPRTMTNINPSDPLTLARSLPALPTPHPGTSYNPTASDHASLLQLAYTSELSKEQKEREAAEFKTYLQKGRKEARDQALEAFPEEEGGKKRKRSSSFSKEGEQERVNQTLVKMMGMDSLPRAEGEELEEEDGGQEESDEEDRVYEIKRKTKAQRARALRAKEEVPAARKQARLAKAELYTLPSLRKKYNAALRARTEAALKIRAKREEQIRLKGLEGLRVGRNRVGEVSSRTEVQLEEDLAEGLRGVKTEGNLFRDRFQSFQARALAETGSNRYPVQKQGRTGKRGQKEFEIPSYRHFK
ncbi:hypothetical protein A4X09_0g4592 [Tilletia walkeri]|uniref:Ribosome biogenesis protein NOP53 n=1 Tax=Tilletia walkeri TaxID=117179 RepID=A0A8X7T4W0_9BASI|nr:hypothetical protein A4X09_0g4592 [Tilletia walkeri]